MPLFWVVLNTCLVFVNTCMKTTLETDRSPSIQNFPFGTSSREAIVILIIEPRHDKTNKMSVHPAKIRSAWARGAKDPRFLHADSEDSDQTGRMPTAKTLIRMGGCPG